MRRFTMVLASAVLAAGACNRPLSVAGAGEQRPPTPPREAGPTTSTFTSLSRDTVLARAVRAMRERGFTEVTPDPAAGQVRGKSRDGVSVVVEATALEGRTAVHVRGFRDQSGAGMDNAAMAQVLTLMSTIAPPPSAADTTRPPPRRR